MAPSSLAAVVVLLVGVAMLMYGARADRAVRRGQHTRGRIVAATKARLADDGRQIWDVQVSFPADAGQDVSVAVRQAGSNVDQRIGEQVDVWFDPMKPERARVALAENAAGTSWVQYALGLALVIGGAGVLLARLG
jgi:Protein of unknown function (DUF3592)